MDRKALFIDGLVLLVYLIAANPAITRIDVHEWMGLAALVVLVAHCCVRADKISAYAKSAIRGGWAARGRFALILIMAIDLVVCVISGIMESGSVLVALGLYATGYFFWGPLHAFSAKLLLALIIVHIATDLDRILSVFRRK